MTNVETIRSELTAAYGLHVAWAGAFGHAVAKYLGASCENVQETEWTGTLDFNPDAWPISDIQIVAAWRPVPALCEFLSNLSHQRVHPFVPLILDSAALFLGPVIVPGKSACWQCWQLRSAQHGRSRQERSALLQFYDANPDSGPAGYLEPFAMIGAAKVASMLQSSDHLDQAAGHIWQLDLFTRQAEHGYLIGVDGCSRCGLGRPLETRTYAEIREKLAFLWREGATTGNQVSAMETNRRK